MRSDIREDGTDGATRGAASGRNVKRRETNGRFVAPHVAFPALVLRSQRQMFRIRCASRQPSRNPAGAVEDAKPNTEGFESRAERRSGNEAATLQMIRTMCGGEKNRRLPSDGWPAGEGTQRCQR